MKYLTFKNVSLVVLGGSAFEFGVGLGRHDLGLTVIGGFFAVCLLGVRAFMQYRKQNPVD